MQPDVIFQDFRHQAVDAAANRGQQHQDIGALVTVSDRALDRGNLPAHAFDPGKQLLFFFRDFRMFVSHSFQNGTAFFS
jgi:hypothetical protein